VRDLEQVDKQSAIRNSKSEIWGPMRTPVIVDGRDVFDAEVCRRKGIVYRGIGKGTFPAPVGINLNIEGGPYE